MPITRFDKFMPRDYSMQWNVPQEVMPNIEAWSSLLTEQQQKYDTAKMLLSEKMPKYLQTEEDRKLFSEYKERVTKNLENITSAYQNKGVSAGKQALEEASRTFIREWQPGGRAATLEDRYTGYQTALKEIEEAYKKDPRGINKQFATAGLKSQLSSPINYNPETGEYQKIATPELYTDPNIQKLILDAIKQVEESGDTDIVRLSPTILQKIKTEGRNPDTLGNIAEAIYNQYPKQMAIESWYRGQSLDPEQVKQQFESNLDSALSKQSKYLEGAESLKKDQIKQLQSDLVEQGFDIKVDGVVGPKTKKAIEDYRNKLQENINLQKSSFDFDTYITKQVAKDYQDFAKSFANKKIDKDIIFDQGELTRMRIAASRRNTDSLISAMQSIANPETNLVGVTPDKGVNIEKWEKEKGNAKANLDKASDLYSNLMSGAAGKILGSNPSNIASMISAYSKSGGDPNQFYNILASSPEFESMKGTDFRKAFDFIQNNQDVISDATNTYISAKQQMDVFDSVEESLTLEYIAGEGKKDFEDLKKQYKKPWETDQQFMQAVLNKDSRFQKSGATILSSVTGQPISSSKGSVAQEFLSKRNNTISKSPKYAKSVRAFEISAPENDKSMGTFSKSILQDIDNNDYYGYVDEDKQGFTWKTKEGKEKEGIVSNRQVSITSFGEKGKPQIKVTGVIKNKDGEQDYVETYLEIPETRSGQLHQSLIAAKAQAKRTNDSSLDEVIDFTLGSMRGDINYTENAAEDAIKLHYKNTKDIPIIMPVYNQKGEISTLRNTNMKGRLLKTQEIGGRIYHKYKVLGDVGNEYYRLTVETPEGEVIVPNKKGGMDFNSSYSADNFLNGKVYDTNLSVTTNIQKVPSGRLLSKEELNAIAMMGTSAQEVTEDNESQ